MKNKKQNLRDARGLLSVLGQMLSWAENERTGLDTVKRYARHDRGVQRPIQLLKIEAIEREKQALDKKFNKIADCLKPYNNLPVTLIAQFELAKERKRVVKGLMTKQQKKFQAQLQN